MHSVPFLAGHQGGGQCVLGQPRGAWCWLEPAAQVHTLDLAVELVCVAAYAYGCAMPRTRFFAVLWRQLPSLASMCTHPEGALASLRGLDSVRLYVQAFCAGPRTRSTGPAILAQASQLQFSFW